VVPETELDATNLSLAYVQQSWVQDFVANPTALMQDEEDEELLIALSA
jgi:hypothetical protein